MFKTDNADYKLKVINGRITKDRHLNLSEGVCDASVFVKMREIWKNEYSDYVERRRAENDGKGT